MTKAEQDALLGYIEFLLTTMVEQNEITLRSQSSVDQRTGDIMVGVMYDNAYEVLNELERSYAAINEMSSLPPSKTN